MEINLTKLNLSIMRHIFVPKIVISMELHDYGTIVNLTKSQRIFEIL